MNNTKVSHPAKFTDVLIPVFTEMLCDSKKILDPFGGTGKIFMLEEYLPDTQISAIEIEPEWASLHPKTQVGDALALPFDDDTFDAVCTSPVYGNRMSDTLLDDYVRITYTAKLGRRLHPNNSGSLQWGKKYKDFHERAWKESRRVLRVGGLFILNIKNHIRKGEEQQVTEWHSEVLESFGFVLLEHRRVETPSMRRGENHSLRIPFESVMKFQLDKKE